MVPHTGTIMTISKDRVKPSPLPDSWKLKEIFATGVMLGGYLALMTVVFFWIMRETEFFPVSFLSILSHAPPAPAFSLFYLSNDGTMQEKFGVRSIKDSPKEMMAALYLQVSIVSQALIFVTRLRSWSYVERPGMLLMGAFVIAQLVRKENKPNDYQTNLSNYHFGRSL